MKYAKSLTSFELVAAEDCDRDQFKRLIPVCPECGVPVFLARGSNYMRGKTLVAIDPYWAHFSLNSTIDHTACAQRIKKYGDDEVQTQQRRGREQRMELIESFLMNLLCQRSFTWRNIDVLKSVQRMYEYLPEKSWAAIGLSLTALSESGWQMFTRETLEKNVRKAVEQLFDGSEFVGRQVGYLMTGKDIPFDRFEWSLRTEQHIQTCTDLFVVFLKASPAIKLRFIWLVFYKYCLIEEKSFTKALMREGKTAALELTQPRKAKKRTSGQGMAGGRPKGDRASGLGYLTQTFLSLFTQELVRTDWFLMLADVVNDPERKVEGGYDLNQPEWYAYFELNGEPQVSDGTFDFQACAQAIDDANPSGLETGGMDSDQIRLIAEIGGLFYGQTYSIVHQSLMFLL